MDPEEQKRIEDEVVEKYYARKALMGKIKHGLALMSTVVVLTVITVCVMAVISRQLDESETSKEEPVIEELPTQE